MTKEQMSREFQDAVNTHAGELIPPPDPQAERKSLWISIALAKARNSPGSINEAWMCADKTLKQFDAEFRKSKAV